MNELAPVGNNSQINSFDQADLKTLTQKEPRLEFDLETDRVALTANDKKMLYKYLLDLTKSGSEVESTLRSKWDINVKFKKINIVIAGPFNVAVASDEITLLVGKPSEYRLLFASTAALYGHELGHYLSFFDEKGGLTPPIGSNRSERMQSYRSQLNANGDLPRKYFNDIPFHLLPSNILFAEDSEKRPGSFYFASELVATKAAIQLCGRDEAKKFVKSMIELRINKKNPYEMMYLLVLAREFGLHSQESLMMSKIKEGEKLWTDTISTDELIAAMTNFFEQVSLKHQ
jgi:hypothetical protein